MVVKILPAEHPFPLWEAFPPMFTLRGSVVTKNEAETETWQTRAPYMPLATAICSEAPCDSNPIPASLRHFLTQQMFKEWVHDAS